MGLDLRADGYAKEEFCMGYIGFGILRQYIAKCYNEEMGAMYEKIYRFPHPELTEAEVKRWNEICDDDLDILLNHSDCGGILKYHECRKIIRALDRIEFKIPDNADRRWYEKYKTLKDMIRYCAKNKKRLYFW